MIRLQNILELQNYDPNNKYNSIIFKQLGPGPDYRHVGWLLLFIYILSAYFQASAQTSSEFYWVPHPAWLRNGKYSQNFESRQKYEAIGRFLFYFYNIFGK